jgi:hypothetical protein
MFSAAKTQAVRCSLRSYWKCPVYLPCIIPNEKEEVLLQIVKESGE